MAMDLNEFNLTIEEKRLFEKNMSKIYDMECDELWNIIKYIFCKYPITLHSINNLELGYDEKKLYDDISKVFENEDYIDMIDYVVDKKMASLLLYDMGWLGDKVFFRKVDKYVKKFEDLGYTVSLDKYFNDESDGLYVWLDFKF